MNWFLTLISLVISFIVTFYSVPVWRRYARRVKLIGRDMNKPGKVRISEMGGLMVMAGSLCGIFYYAGITTFVFRKEDMLLPIFVITSVILVSAFIGSLDDILGWKKGLKQWEKPLLVFPAAVPVMVVNFTRSTIVLPLLGKVDFGILYPLILIPIGISGAANGFNLLAGYNGLEAGMGVIILTTLGIVAILNHYVWLAIITFSVVSSLLAFLRYNWYPARVFPGNVLTYFIGAFIACIAIMGNMEKIALLLFIPYFIDFFLPLRKKFKVEAFAKVNPDGSLDPPYRSPYDFTHLIIMILKKFRKRVYEKEVVMGCLGFEIVLAVGAILWALKVI